MSSGTVRPWKPTFVHTLGRIVIDFVSGVGDLALFAMQMLGWLLTRLPHRSTLTNCCYQIGVQSILVVVITGGFIGMVLAVQAYDQFHMMRLETRLGAVINISLVKELGPVLAAMMLAGRVGSAMAAELGTMRVTEQIDALSALGVNPVHYLVIPRFLACFLLTPLLTGLADVVGIISGWLFSTQALGINSSHYWHHGLQYVTAYDVMSGLVKSIFFGAAIAVIACHRGFHCGAGAEGVGQAATQSFVLSFISILGIDFFLGMLSTRLYYLIWSNPSTLF